MLYLLQTKKTVNGLQELALLIFQVPTISGGTCIPTCTELQLRSIAFQSQIKCASIQTRAFFCSPNMSRRVKAMLSE